MPWIKTLPSGPFETNAYLCGADDSDKAFLIDAPPSCRAGVAQALAESDRKLEALLITHPHFDHTMDAGTFSADGVTVYAHSEAIAGIQNPETLGLIPEPAGGFPVCESVTPLEVGASLKLAGLHIGVLNVPGHSDGSVALMVPDACFVGDLVFRSSVGRTDLPGGDFDTLAESIQTMIYTLPEETVLYPGHGPSTTVGREKRSNPYVRG